MKFSALLLLGIAALAAADDVVYDEENDVIVLSEDNFDEVVESVPLLLVEFYAPWCGHCKKLAPEYEKAAATLKEREEPLRIAKLDATEARDLSSKYGVRGFPTLKLFRGLDSISDYEGGRTANDIVKYMVKKSGPAFATVEDAEALKKLTDANDVVVLGLFKDGESDAATLYKSMSANHDEYIFAFTTADALLKEYGSESGIAVLKDFDEGNALTSFTGEGDDAEKDAMMFLAGESLPLVVEFSQDTAPKIFGGDIDVHVLTFVDKDADYYDGVKDFVGEIAKEYKGRALQVIVPKTEGRIVDYFGFKEEDMPTTVIAAMDEGGMKKYALEGKSSKDAVAGHVAAYFAGSLKPTLKSEEPKPEDTEGPVTVLTGKTFNELVIDNDKDVLVEFYAPWCGHCKALAPKYDELGEKFAGIDSVTIAKIDSTANEIDVDGVNVKGFPTLYFFKGDSKPEAMLYNGGREVDAFVSFLEKNAATPFTLDDAGDAGADEL